MVWGVLRDDDRGHAGADALPPQYLLDGDVGRATDISPPNDSVNVFPEYAGSETWTAVHIRQFVSTPFIVRAFSDPRQLGYAPPAVGIGQRASPPTRGHEPSTTQLA